MAATSPSSSAAGGKAPAAEGVLPVDVYGGTFPCVHWDTDAQTANPLLELTDGGEHTITLEMRPSSSSSSELTAEGNTPVVWFDNHGQLGKLRGATGSDVATSLVAEWIDAGYLLVVSVDLSDGSHPALVIHSAELPAPPEPELPPAPPAWLEPIAVAEYLDIPGDPDARMVGATAAVRAAVEARRSELDFTSSATVPANVLEGAKLWAAILYQQRAAPTGFAGYDEASAMFDSLGARRAEVMRLLGWRRPVTA
jgi:hypothetical protein